MESSLVYEIIGWIALILNIIGNLALAKKSISGWIVRLACNAAFIIYSYFFNVYPLLVNHIIFAFVNIYGWLEWKKSILKCKCGREHDIKDIGKTCNCELPIK